MAPPSLRTHQFTHPEEFLEAARHYDDSWMNFAIGALLDAQQDPNESWEDEDEERVLIGVYRGEDLLMTFTHNANDFAWVISIVNPKSRIGGLEESDKGSKMKEEYKEAIDLLVAFLPNIPFVAANLSKVDKFFGEAGLVEEFCEVWAGYRNRVRESEGKVVVVKKCFESRVAWVTKDTLPPDSSLTTPRKQEGGEQFEVVRAESEKGIDDLARLYVQFIHGGPIGGTASEGSQFEEGRRVMGKAIQRGRIWFCRPCLAFPSIASSESSSEIPEITGYVLVGRITTNTTSIRNLFVLPDWRKRGIAEKMVGIATRYWLEEGGKEEVSLNVGVGEEDGGARKVYGRCGYAVGDHGDSVQGERSFRSRWWVVEEQAQP